MSKLKLEVLFNATDKVSGPIKTIIGGSKSMAAALKKTNTELKDLESQQRKISGFRQLTSQSEKTAQSLAKNKETIAELKQALKINPEAQETVTALARAEAAHKRLMAVQKSQSKELTGMAQEFNKAGIQMDRLNEEESDLKNKIHLTTMELNKQKEVLGKHEEAQKKYEKMQARMGKANEMAKKGLMIAGAGAASLAVPVKIAIDYESAMADVAKVVDGLKDEAGKITPAYKLMSDQIVEMTTRLPMAAKDIAAIVAAGAQSGIAKNELLGFAESAVKMGVAFDITADQAGQSMAEMRAAFKLTQPQVVALADRINYLGNTSPNKADKIMEVVQRIGALGEVGGFASSSIAAMAASLTSVEPDVAATGIKNMILALTKGESATKGQSAAFKKLGLDSVQVSKDMQKDAEATVAKVIEGIQKLEKHEQVAITNELFGSEALPIVMQYSQGLDTLKKNLNAVSDAKVYAGSMEAEYAARAATTANNIQLAKNHMAALGITIGNVLLPGVNSMIGSFNGVMSAVQKWSQANPGLSSGLVKIAIGAIAIVGGLSALSIGLIAVFGPMMMVGRAFGVVAMAARAMSMALLTNPITWIVLAIAGAAFLIYKNWAPISAFFVGIWTTIKTAFNGGIRGISALIVNWSPIGLFYSAFAKVLSWFGIDLPAKFTGFGAMILEGLKNGILSKVNAVKDAITGAVSGVIDKARGILGIHSPSRVFMGIGGYTMQGMANGIANANNLPVAATTTATQGVVDTAVKTKPVKPISMGGGSAKSFVSNDTINITIQAKDGSFVKGTAEALRQELQRVVQEEQNAKRKFLTDTE
ncbi:phage tail tape measure protein [Acinetobacter bohemicus]|uniref:phage tail tape measure protein n=1 Tax=Acinetobacter TaxID=469 RepID=UPI00209AFE21|nr:MULTISPECIES: phage tail tape measure protein [Acinetobacter]MCO8043630.1 phage tail tape measure protein [Acinetobacter sp. S4400-12]MCU7225151.1 phage tail tape measure protein [Acinetobacter bohemicus]